MFTRTLLVCACCAGLSPLGPLAAQSIASPGSTGSPGLAARTRTIIYHPRDLIALRAKVHYSTLIVLPESDDEPSGAAEAAAPPAPQPQVRIDFDGFEDRVRALPVASSNYADLQARADAVFFRTGEADHLDHLKMWSLKDQRASLVLDDVDVVWPQPGLVVGGAGGQGRRRRNIVVGEPAQWCSF